MKAVRVIPGADGGQLEVQDLPDPNPGPNEVLVRIFASGLNFGEIKYMREHRAGNPMTAGVEFAGEVVRVGEQVSGWRQGDRDMGHGRGCHAQYVVAAPLALMPVPKDVSWIDAAASRSTAPSRWIRLPRPMRTSRAASTWARSCSLPTNC
jgi:NADPH2:quinone reductase